ncbi:hypothetical protein EJD97_016159 [Solanum chilense]|uniref:ABC transporter domain-containing protein n=1 Tax=Solanum chilense TaxID=4083 RepID=A0A6N2BAJ5_SOLCI|nr:hypothetical protein EJD97_016159 [Solanum chilense]
MLAELSIREKEANIKPDPDVDIFMKAGQDTSVVTDYILKPARETYNLVGDIVLLSDGPIAYQGSHENILEFFEYMGFRCPERKGEADFLLEVTSREDQEQYSKLGDELGVPFDKSKSHPAALTTQSVIKGVLKPWSEPQNVLSAFASFYVRFSVVIKMASALFCLLAALGRNLIVANTLGSFALLTVMVMGGFIVSRGYISSSVEKLQVQYTTYMFTLSEWWIWGYWFLPLIYAQNAIAVNEFLGKSWAHVPPNSTDTLGETLLKLCGLFPSASWKSANAERGDSERRNAEETTYGAYDGVSGAFRPGVLTALMGVTGAGKTTMIDVLAGRKTGGHIEGIITYMRVPHEARNICLNSRTLKLTLDSATRRRKRVELVSSPSTRFMDEPISALNATAAAIVMRIVRNEVDTGRTVTKEGYNPATWMLEITTAAQVRNFLESTLQNCTRTQSCSMYAAVMFLSVQNSSTVQPIISIDRTVFYRKREAGMYSALPLCFWEGTDSYSLMDWH